MKKTFKKLSLVIAVASVIGFAVGCETQKNDEASTSSKEQIEALFDKMAPEMQTFTIDPTQPNTITGEDGTVITIPANSLVDANGNPVTGSVTISLQEILSIGDQLTSGVSAVSNGQFLSSGGEFYFTATLNGKTLDVDPSNPITVVVPADQVDSTMQVFLGDMTNDKEGDSTVNWVLPTDTTTQTDTSSYINYQMQYSNDYTIILSNLYQSGWYNIDCYVDWNNLIQELVCEINVNNNEYKEEIDFLLKTFYKEYACVSYKQNTGVVTATQSLIAYEYWMPGKNATVIVTGKGKKSGKLYYGTYTFTVNSNSKPVINLTMVTEAELKTLISAL